MSGGGNRGGSPSSERPRKSPETSKTKSGGAGGKPPSGDECDLSFAIDLEGVNTTALAKVKVGVVLEVIIVRTGTGYEAVACQIPKSHETVGTLAAFPDLGKLIACIKQGNTYVASVVGVQRGGCTVSVQRK